MQQSKYYTSIVDLPLNRFVDALVDQNIFALVISGEPDKLDLQSAWDDIILEYNDAMSDNEGKLYFKLLREARLLLVDVKQIEVNVALLKLEYDKSDADELNSILRTNFSFDASDIERYYSDLDRCLRMSRGFYLKYQVKSNQIEALKLKNEQSNTKPTKEYFISILITLKDHSGVQLEPTTITTWEFCERVRRYNEYIKNVESRNKK